MTIYHLKYKGFQFGIISQVTKIQVTNCVSFGCTQWSVSIVVIYPYGDERKLLLVSKPPIMSRYCHVTVSGILYASAMGTVVPNGESV